MSCNRGTTEEYFFQTFNPLWDNHVFVFFATYEKKWLYFNSKLSNT